MKKLGIALHVVQQKIIVQNEPLGSESQMPKINSLVIGPQKKRIGKVLDVFGPVSHPYLIVRLNKGIDPMAQVGKKLYVEETSRRDSKW